MVRRTGIECAVAAAIIFGGVQFAVAGWTGGMNGVGYGQASVNVRAYDTSALKTKTVTTSNMTNPSVAMTITTGYVFGGTLPAGASSATVAKVKTLPGYIWQADTVGSNGDSTDNPELESRVTITAADCAALSMDSSSVIDTNAKSGMITINLHGTGGTAYWTRGFELLGGQVPPEDDPNTTTNEFVEFLKTHGGLKWDVLVVGPMNQDTTNCTAINIPFSYETDITNLYFVSDGVAKSLPLVIECPTNIVVSCQQSVSYPATVLVGGCGNITVSFNPPPLTNGAGSIVPFPPGYFPVGTTNNVVEVTATDKDGNTAKCTFNIVVTDTNAPVIPPLPTLISGCTNVTLPVPTATDNCGGTVTVTPNVAQVFSTPGTNIVKWTFTDGAGNSSFAYQTGIVAGVTFQGFYSPVGTANNTITNPVTRTAGSSFPLKWDMLCGTSPITGGTPPKVEIQKVSPSVGPVTILNAEYQNDWHINWPTPSTTKNDIYKATVNLPGGSKAVLFVKFK